MRHQFGTGMVIGLDDVVTPRRPHAKSAVASHLRAIAPTTRPDGEKDAPTLIDRSQGAS